MDGARKLWDEASTYETSPSSSADVRVTAASLFLDSEGRAGSDSTKEIPNSLVILSPADESEVNSSVKMTYGEKMFTSVHIKV